MGRKAKFGDDIRKRAIELRGKGFTLTDIRDALKRENGEAPALMWVQRAVKDVAAPKATAEKRADELVAIVDEQEIDGVDINTEMLRQQARELVALRQELKDNPSAVAQLSRALIATMQLIDKRTPPPPPPKEENPDWIAAAESCKQKLREKLQKMIDNAKSV